MTEDHLPDARIPIVLGVVGHRYLPASPADVDTLRAALRTLFDEFDAEYPDSPKLLLSPLAPGADQLAAEVALARGWRVRAPLPFERRQCLASSSFRLDRITDPAIRAATEAKARQQFHDWLDDPRVEWFTVPLPDVVYLPAAVSVRDGETRPNPWTEARRTGDGWVFAAADGRPPVPVDWDRVAADDPARCEPHELALCRACYANPGGYIVRHCHTLVALWDGRDSGRPSGTHEAVRFQLGGLAPTYYPWTPHEPLGFDADRGPAVLIHSPQPPRDAADAARRKADRRAVGDREVRVPSGRPGGNCYGRTTSIRRVARRLGRWERFWDRVCVSWGHHHHSAEAPAWPAYLPPPSATPGNVSWWTGLRKHVDEFAEELPTRIKRWRRRTTRGLLRRLGRPAPPTQRLAHRRYPEHDQFLSVCQTLDDFNAGTRRTTGRQVAYGDNYAERVGRLAAEAAAVFPAGDRDADPERHSGRLHDWYARLGVVFAAADHQCGRWLNVAWTFGVAGLFATLFVAVMAMHVYTDPFGRFADPHGTHAHPWGLLVAFLVLWLVMTAWVVVSWLYRWENQRLDYRALAEALRVRRAWAVAGSGRSVADTYLSQLRTELAWVRRALQHLCPPPHLWAAQFDALDPARRQARLAHARVEWVYSQERQYAAAKAGKHRLAVRLRRGGALAAALGLGVYASLLVGFPFRADPPEKLATPHDTHATSEHHAFGYNWIDPVHPAPGVLVLGGMLLTFGGVLIAVCERRAYESLARQYDHIHAVFRAGGRELDVILDPPQLTALRTTLPPGQTAGDGPLSPAAPTGTDFTRAKRVVEALGREALQEGADWLLLHRSRPLELALGG